ncbi:MAG TPA: hypothetical protein VN426_05805 [Syntrophomonadaceae bacterium]|nr:hypothetical protein [Syntrophomonadaceae bacterium]
MNSNRALQKILQDLEQLDAELAHLSQGCEFTRQRRLCSESQTMLQGIHASLERGFADMNSDERFTGSLDTI